MNELRHRLLEFLGSRKRAYARVFDKENLDVKVVLSDLFQFCRVGQSTYHPDPRMHAVLEGRREVALRIIDHLGLTTEELLRHYDKRKEANE